MTRNQLAAYFQPSAQWANSLPMAVPQSPAGGRALDIVRRIMGAGAVQLPGIADVAAPPVPNVLFGLEDALQRIYTQPSAYKLIVPVGVRRLCAAIVKTPCGAPLASAIANPQPQQ